MTAIPKSLAAATRLLEEYADLDGRIALIEEDRTADIAAANQRADVAAEPMLKRRQEITAAVESWWPAAAPHIAGGKKSMQLGGCMIGTRASRDILAHSLDSDDKATAALRGSRLARLTTRVKYSIDRTATLKLLQLGGKTAATLVALGFRIEQGSDKFFVERAEQVGTITS